MGVRYLAPFRRTEVSHAEVGLWLAVAVAVTSLMVMSLSPMDDFNNVHKSLYWFVHERELLHLDGFGFVVCFSPSLVGVINRWDRELVDVVWLTTWFGSTGEFSKLGFDGFLAIGPDEGSGVDFGEWKAEVGANFIETSDYKKVVWVDDGVFVNEVEQLVEGLGKEFLRVNPVDSVGLSPSEVCFIEKFLVT